MKIAIFTLAAVFAQEKEQFCAPGRAIGIDKDGNEDLSNKNKCFVTKEAAQVTRCNVVGGDKAEMEVKVLKDLFPIDWNPADHQFTVSGDGKYYERVYQPSEMADKSTADDLILQAGVPFTGESTLIGTQTVFTKVEGSLSFRCRYPLGTRTIKETFNVSGHDIYLEREGTGELGYTIAFDAASVDIGDWNQFKVKPSNPDLVHAQVQSCTISNESKSDNLIVFGHDNNFCRNEIIQFTVVSGFGSQQDQVFKYKAFKWSTDETNKNEKQHITCVVDLQRNAFAPTPTPFCDANNN